MVNKKYIKVKIKKITNNLQCYAAYDILVLRLGSFSISTNMIRHYLVMWRSGLTGNTVLKDIGNL